MSNSRCKIYLCYHFNKCKLRANLDKKKIKLYFITQNIKNKILFFLLDHPQHKIANEESTEMHESRFCKKKKKERKNIFFFIFLNSKSSEPKMKATLNTQINGTSGYLNFLNIFSPFKWVGKLCILLFQKRKHRSQFT